MNDPLIEEWVATYKGSGNQTSRRRHVKEYLDYRKLTAREALDEKREHPSDGFVEKTVIKFKEYSESIGKTETVAFSATVDIRAFYAYHRLDLKFRRNELKKPAPKETDHRLTLPEIDGTLKAAELRGKALISTAESTGLRISDLALLNRAPIEEEIERQEPPVFLGETYTIKEGIYAHPFLHATAVRYIKEYLAKRTDNSELLFPMLSKPKQIIKTANLILRNAFRRADFKVARGTRLRFHCIRKYTISRMQDADIEENLWKALVGRKQPEKSYSSDKYREAYMKVLPRLDPSHLVNNHKRVQELENVIKEQQEKISTLERKYEQLERAKTLDAFLNLVNKERAKLEKEISKQHPIVRSTAEGFQLRQVKIGNRLVDLSNEDDLMSIAVARAVKQLTILKNGDQEA